MKNTHLLLSLGLLASIFALSSCNTMEGLGEDLSAGGKKIDREAEQHRNY